MGAYVSWGYAHSIEATWTVEIPRSKICATASLAQVGAWVGQQTSPTCTYVVGMMDNGTPAFYFEPTAIGEQVDSVTFYLTSTGSAEAVFTIITL
jgi:hypothetical protein